VDVIEALRTARTIRHIEPRDVPDDLINSIIEAATWAPSPGNSQGWDFVVVRDTATKATLRDEIAPALREIRAVVVPEPDAAGLKMHAAADHLLDSLAEIPVVIFVCGRAVYPPAAPMDDFVWSALYPAVQNLRIAARAHGLAAPMTTAHVVAEPIVRELLGIPDDVKIVAMVPIGWPARPFGPVRRRPAAEVTHHERWDSTR
jgi:nitroreductase